MAGAFRVKGFDAGVGVVEGRWEEEQKVEWWEEVGVGGGGG